MRQMSLVMAAMVAALATGCAQRVVQESGGDIVLPATGESWGGTFRGREGWGDTRGSVFARPVDGGTQVALTVEGGIPGSRYGWEVREGACGTNGRVLGEAAKYIPILLGDRGMGDTVTQLPMRLEAGKQYSVNLYGDATERTLVIGCGALTR
jgi:hypothetical protein